MCTRYELAMQWQEYVQWSDISRRDWSSQAEGSAEIFPRHRMPIIRLDDEGLAIAERRQWGFIMMMNGKRLGADGKPNKIRRDVVNAMSEKLTTGFPWRFAFTKQRCLIPMSAWYEWPPTPAGKQLVRVSMPSEPVFMAAGLYDVNQDPKTNEVISVYTMCTVPPNEFLGTVHDRAPMVLLPSQYGAWLAGGQDALSLVGTHPDATAFQVDVVSPRT